MLPPGKDIITNKDINILSTKKDKSLPPKLAKSPPGFKSLINQAEDDCNDSTDTSRTDTEYCVNNLKAINNKYIDEKYKDEKTQDHNINGIQIVYRIFFIST